MTFLKRWGMWGVVLCLLAAGALALFASWMTRLQWTFVIAAAVLFVISAALNWRESASVLGRPGMPHRAAAPLLVPIGPWGVALAKAVPPRYTPRWARPGRTTPSA